MEMAIDEEISLGDYVLSGGEVPAMALIEGASRLLPGVLGNPESVNTESFQGPVLEGPQYTRPAEFRGQAVPPVLLSGDHGAIAQWREKQSIEYTRKRRPDLLEAREGEERS
jgi:tRNA (guanine37-N1)-methyltransferase